MSTVELSTPILEGGVRAVNFFNGRLLSGEDLTQESAAHRLVSRRLGQALGAGVASGLEVTETLGTSTPQAPVLSIASGLAVNSRGQPLALTETATIALVRPEGPPSLTVGRFDECQPPQQSTGVVGTGVYLLVLSPASAGVGRAPYSGLSAGSGACDPTVPCNTRYKVEGVQFRLVPLPLSVDQLNATGLLRNVVAYLCFGIGDPLRSGFAANPFSAPTGDYGLLGPLRASGALTPCDVPLAVVHWVAATGIGFIDMWTVRRRLTDPSADDRWSLVVGDRRRSEAEAMFRQFQDHIAAVTATQAGLDALLVTDRFGYLPSAGLVPIAGAGSPRGVDPATFFLLRGSQDVALIDSDRLGLLLREALDHEPIDLGAAEKIQLYLIRENMQAVADGTSGQLVLAFAGSTLPYRGVARFGSAKWDLSRFAQSVI